MGQGEVAEPRRPVLVQVPGDPNPVLSGSAPLAELSHGEPTSAFNATLLAPPLPSRRRDRRMTYSATARFDGPARTEAQVGGEGAGTDDGVADAQGEHLGAGAEGEGVGAGHPRQMMGDVATADGREAKDDAGGHGRTDGEPQHVGQLPIPRCTAVSDVCRT